MSSSVNNQIEAVVFDCYGVLYHDGFKEFMTRYEAPIGGAAGQCYDLIRQYDSGWLEAAQLHGRLAQLAGITAGKVQALMENRLTLNRELVRLIQHLRPYYQIGLLTNADRTALQPFLDYEAVGKHFDVVLASSEVGMVKPQAGIYRAMANRLGLPLDELAFIDDSAGHVAAAESLGMRAHVYQSVRQLRDDLADLLASADAASGRRLRPADL